MRHHRLAPQPRFSARRFFYDLASHAAHTTSTTRSHLLKGQVRSSDDVEHDPRGPVDGRVEKGAADGRAGRVLRPRLARAGADTHERCAGVAHDGSYVREVDVDEAGTDDDLGDAHDALAEDVVGDGEGALDGGVGGDDLEELKGEEGDC